MSKDARQKLRDMGGIMASSPELMQAVQKFNNGGPIMPPATGKTLGDAPDAGSAPFMPFSLTPPELIQDYNYRNISKFRRPQTSSISGSLPSVERNGPIMPPAAGRTLPPAPLTGFQPPRPMPIGSQFLIDDYVFAPSRPRELPRPSGPGALPVGLRELVDGDNITPDDLLSSSLARMGSSISRRKARPDRPLYTEGDLASVSGGSGGTRRPLDPNEMPKGVPGDAKQTMGEYLTVPTIGDQVVEDLASRRNAPPIGRNVESLEGPEATGLGGQIRSDDTLTVTEDDTVPAPDETLPPMITNDPEGTASEALSSLDKSYEEKLALFQKVFGDDDEDKSRDRAMSLAMIGLAIAAGQSPNALTNIAQGAMVGLKAMGEQRKERQAKKEKVKVMALDAALREHAAQQKFARELGLEAIKAGNKSQYRDTPTVRQEGAFGDVEVFLPTPQAAQQGAQPIIADVAGLDRKYKQSLDGRQKVFGMVDQAEQLIEQYDIAGFEGAMARFKQDFSAATPKFLKEAIGFDGTSGTPTPQQQYDTLMRAMAAQFTPIILGESGRTISDGDRQRVAQILGFAVDQTTGKIGQYKGTAFTSEAELKSALSEVRSILGSSYSEMDRIYSRYRPEQYIKLQENNQKQTPSNRLRFDINGNPVE